MGSIYAITPCTEETARAFAGQMRAEAFSTYEAPRLPGPVESPVAAPVVSPEEWDDSCEDEDDDYDD